MAGSAWGTSCLTARKFLEDAPRESGRPLRRSDGGYVPFPGNAFELVSAAVLEIES